MIELLNQDPISLVKELVLQLEELHNQSDINITVFRLQSMGYLLQNIRRSGFGIIGEFRNGNFVEEIHVPYYKIDEDIIDQLYNMIEEYNSYRLETPDAEIQINKNYELESINWLEIYNTPEYIRLFLETATELLFSKLEGYLRKHKKF